MKACNAQVGFVCLAGMTAASFLSGTATAQPSYRVTDLGSPQGAGSSEAFGLNDQGQVVGEATAVDLRPHAFVWLPAPALGFPTAGIHDLGVLGGNPFDENSVARSINEAGLIVGRSSTDFTDNRHAFLWAPPGAVPPGLSQGLNDLGTLAGSLLDSEAWDINDEDPSQVVGWAQNGEFCTDLGFISRAFRWSSAAQVMVDIGSTLGLAEAFAVNTVLPGQLRIIGGHAIDCNTTPPPAPCNVLKQDEPVVWVNGIPGALGVPALFGDISGEARGVNTQGTLVGWSKNESNNCLDEALIWVSGATGVVLQTIPPGLSAKAEAINISDWVVGFNDTTDRAAIWQPDGSGGWTYTELNELISPVCNWDLREARDINDADGSIVGWGFHDVAHRAFLLTPIGSCPWDLDGDGSIGILDL